MKKLLLFMICMIFLMGNVSSADWDDIKLYDKKTSTYTLENFFGLGKHIAELELKTPQVFVVPIGYQKVAEIEIRNGEYDYEEIINGIELYNINDGMKEIVRDIDYKYLGYEEVPDYEDVCVDKEFANKTIYQRCSQVEKGTKLSELRWVDFTKNSLLKGEIITFGLFTYVYEYDKIEWILNVYGNERLTKWAIFVQSSGTQTFADFNGLNYTIQTFTSNGTFNVTGDPLNVSVLIVAGGGGGATGGGGAGGLIYNTTYWVNGNLNVIVGEGGGVAATPSYGTAGQNSSFGSLFTFGGGQGGGGTTQDGFFGGSGGGGSASTNPKAGGNGVVGQGNDGGANAQTSAPYPAGGGGGAGTVGGEGGSDTGGAGGTGSSYNIYNGTPLCYAGGGGGGYDSGAGTGGTGGCYAGDGDGGAGYGTSAVNGTGSGGGGGGGSGYGGKGGNGIVIVRYLTSDISPVPTIILDSPIDNANFTITNNVIMNATIFDATNITNASLIIDDVYNETNTTAEVNNSVYTFIKNMGEGDHTWTIEACNFNNSCANASQRTFNVNTTPNIVYGAGVPVNEFNSTTDFFEVNVTLTETFFKNVTFDLYNVLGAINRTVTFTNASREKDWTNLIDGKYSYNVTTATNINQFNNTATRNISVDTINPAVVILAPPERVGFHILNTNLFFNWSVNDTNLDACVYEYGGVNTTVTCSDNTTEINITNFIDKTITFYVNDTFGRINVTSVTLSYTPLFNLQTYNTTYYETELNNFAANISYDSSLWTDISANLYYNSTRHPATILAGSGDNLNYSVTISRLFTTPNVKPFFWNFRFTNVTGTFDYNSSEFNQTEQQIQFINCYLTTNTTYVNFTFKDEGNSSDITASIPTSTFVYTLGNFTINKSLTYINTTQNISFAFCLNPPNRTLYIDYALQYVRDGYQQRILEETLTLTSTLTSKILYLLANADGLFVTFQVISQSEQPIEDAIINASRIISGAETIVGTGLTSAAGSKTFWLNPNFLHTIKVFKTGYAQFTTSLFPTQTSYTINLGAGAVMEEEDYTKGVSYDIFPKGSVLNSSQVFTFNFTLVSTYWDVDEFSFTLRDENGNIFDIQTASTNGGTLTTTLNTSLNDTILMDYYWMIDGSHTNLTRSWIIFTDIEDDSWSIKIIFEDLIIYMNSGMFGLDNFGLAIITFFIIFIFTGVMSARFGITAPHTISIFLLTLVLFFDVGLNLFEHIGPKIWILHFPTIFIALVMIGVFIREGLR